MKFASAPITAFALIVFSLTTHAQTYTKCNPIEQSCPADPALGGTSQVNFASGASSQYTGTGNTISYNSDGAQLSVAASGNNPTLTSSFYIMFGHVDIVMKAAPGVGMVSSAILISDNLDEIDWEMLGSDATQGQTNYFVKGVTGSYNRGGFASVPTSQSDFNTYSIDWTATEVNWLVNGVVVRNLPYSESAGSYPQSPMQIKVGAWAGGDSTNAPGTITWAGGPINYADGPFVMQVQSISATDYSTGTEYRYEGTSGTWQSITAVGGSVGTGPSGGSNPSQSSSHTTSSTLSSSQSFTALSVQHSSTAQGQSLGASTTQTTLATVVSTVGASTLLQSAATSATLALTSPSSKVTGTGSTPTSTLTPFSPNAASRFAGNDDMAILMTGCFTALVAFLL